MNFSKIIEVIKLILSSGAFIAAIITAVKYFYEKNRELYIRRLNEVYAPLFSYLIKQETVRALYSKHITIKEAPILSMINVEENTKMNFLGEVKEKTVTEKPIIERKEFIKILKDTNKGLINPKLLKLLNVYEMLIYFEETLEKDSDKWEIAIKKKVEVEYELFKEVQIGYEDTIRKLQLDDKMEIDDLENFNL